MPSVILSEKQFKKINEEQDDNHLNSIKYFLLQQSNSGIKNAIPTCEVICYEDIRIKGDRTAYTKYFYAKYVQERENIQFNDVYSGFEYEDRIYYCSVINEYYEGFVGKYSSGNFVFNL
jgi:hypothetical protein